MKNTNWCGRTATRARKLLGSAGLFVAAAGMLLSGCGGLETLPVAARAGDTIVVATGWQKQFSRDQLTVTITDKNGVQTVYLPNDPAVRAVVNMYPDPLSYTVIGTRVQAIDGGEYEQGASNGQNINGLFTNGDQDWWQTSVFVDLPTNLPDGDATIGFANAVGDTYGPVSLVILTGTGTPLTFQGSVTGTDSGLPISADQLHGQERAEHWVVTFSGGGGRTFSPHAIEVNLTHDPDIYTTGGAGYAFPVNPRGEIKSLNWTDDGTKMKVLLMRAGDTAVTRKDFKFYLSGGATGWMLDSVTGYDENGAAVPEFTGTLTGPF